MKSVSLQKGFKAHFDEDAIAFSGAAVSARGGEFTAQGGRESRGL